MQNKPKNVILLVVIIILLVVGLVYILFINQKKEKVNNSLQEDKIVNKILSQEETKEYKNNELGFSFKYPKEFGSYSVQTAPSPFLVYFDNLYDDLSLSNFSISSSNYEETDKNYISSKRENSTGDYNPYISGAGWKNEKILLENNKDGDITCLTDKDGVFRAVFCHIKTIGSNKFLIKYSRDSYKGSSTIKEYVIYNKDIRYEIGGGKGLSFVSYFPDYESPNWEGKDKYILGTVDNLKNHNLSKEEILVEEMLKTFVFNLPQEANLINNETSIITKYANIKSLYKKDNKYYIDVSYFELITGKEALEAQVKEGWCKNEQECISDYYQKDINKNGTLEISPNIEITVDPRGLDRDFKYETIDLFIKYLNPKYPSSFFDLKIEDNKVISMIEFIGN